MNDATQLSLQAIQSGVARGEYVHVPAVPIFDEHDEYDWRKTVNGQSNPNYGQLIRRYDRSRLEQVANRNNQRDTQTGSLALIGPGHTIPGASVPETSQPAPWGVQANYRVAPFGPGGKTGLLADHYVRKEHYPDYAKTFPRRSIEIYYEGSPHQDLIDWCALLRRSSERDLGLISYSAEAHQRFSPWEGNPDRVADPTGRVLPACYSRTDQKLRYSMEANMPDPNVMIPPAQPPAAPPGLSPEDMAKADAYMAHYMAKNPWMGKAAAQYSAPAPLGPNSAAPPAPVDAQPPNAPALPPTMTPPALPPAPVGPVNPLMPGEDDKARMQREAEAGRYARMEQELAAARAREAEALQRETAALARYERAECERQMIQLESEHIELDRAAEVDALVRLSAAERPQRIEHIKKYYRRSITDPTLLTPGDVPGDRSDAYDGLTPERFRTVTRFMREHPGTTWDTAKKTCPQ